MLKLIANSARIVVFGVFILIVLAAPALAQTNSTLDQAQTNSQFLAMIVFSMVNSELREQREQLINGRLTGLRDANGNTVCTIEPLGSGWTVRNNNGSLVGTIERWGSRWSVRDSDGKIQASGNN